MKRGVLGPSRILDAAFGARISSGRTKPRDLSFQESENNRWVFLAVLLLIFVLLGLARLADLQFIKGSYYQALADGNRIRRIPIKAPRGEILDRNGVPLARNVPVYKLAVFSTGGIVESTQVIPREEALSIQSRGEEEASRLLVDTGREYPLGEAAAHLVGYVNEAGQQEVGKKVECLGSADRGGLYQLGDLVGRGGVEEEYDCLLRGTNGEELIEVDARGRLVRHLGRREPIGGQTIKLSVDAQLQTVAYQALLDAPNEKGTAPRRESGEIVQGAVVVQNPQNGEVLVLVSSPSFDPARLRDKYGEFVTDQNLPFFNRAIGGAYHPGSTFKIITSTSGLEEGKITRDYQYDDPGILKVGTFSYSNWYFTRYGRTEGVINIVRAIARSTDTFFYNVGELVGPTKMAQWASVFNLGRRTGIDLPGEVAGLVPTPEWKMKTKGERWFLGNTYHMSIGQGDVTATPLQINAMASAVAKGGKWCVPHVVTEEQNFQCRELGIKSENLEIVLEGMISACSPGGTAGQFFNFYPRGGRVACKTGTAQFAGDPSAGSGRGKTHAWFTSFAPVATESAEVKPEISATALVEGGGEGSVVAAPIIKKIYQAWFGE